MDAGVEWQMWRQLRGAFNIDRFIFTPVFDDMTHYSFDQAETIDSALKVLPKDTARCFLEPTGKNDLSQLPAGDIALIIGNTAMNNTAFAEDHETYRIKTPTKTHLYGTNAAAIALAIRCGNGANR